MNGFGQMSLVLLVATACQVYGQVQTSTPCSLSFYRYLFNLPGEKIRPNVPEGTYVFGKRVGPPTQEAQASNVQPAVLKPAPSYEAPQYLPPPKPTTTTTTTTTTTQRPSTSAPLYIPPAPPSPYYPAEASNTVSVVQPAKPACDHPEHRPIDNTILPPYRYDPAPKFQQQPTFVVPQYAPVPQKSVPINQNQIFVGQQKPAPVHRYPVPTPPPQFLKPFVQPYAQPTVARHENCEKHRPIPTTTTAAPAPTTTPESVVETRQNEIVILPEAPRKADCGHKQHNVVVESLGVPSTDYGVVSAPAPSVSAGYSYDKPSPSFAYPTVVNTGYAYPKPSPSFDYPSGYSGRATANFESDSSKSSAGNTEDGDLVILKV